MSYFQDSGYSYASAGNSTTTPLTGGSTFTGTGEQNDSPDAFVMTKADADGTLYFDFSNDGTNWDSTYPAGGYSCSANIPEVHVARKAGRYFRVRYVNGSSAQTYIRLTTYYGTFGELMASANQSVSRDSDAKVVRLYTDPQDEIVLGQRNGVRHYTKFGYLPDIDTTDNEIMITADPAKPVEPEVLTSGETFSIAYTPASDGAGTTGATILYFDYVDSNGEFATGTHVLGSSSPDTTSFSGLGINRVAVAASGSADTNVAAITVTSSSSGGVHAYIPAGQGVTQQALFHTPSNAVGVAKLLFANVNKLAGGSTPKMLIKGWVHSRTVDTKFEVFRYLMDTATESHITLNEPIGFKLSAGDILYFTADTDTSNATVSSFRFSLNIYDNT